MNKKKTLKNFQILFNIAKKNNIKIILKMNKSKKKNGLRGDNKLAKKILNWRPKKNIFIAAQEIFNYE